MSSRPLFSLALIGIAGLTACSSNVDSSFDPVLLQKVNTILDCMPAQVEKLDELITFGELWRLNDSTNPADPGDLAWTYSGGDISFTLSPTGFMVTGTISFYSPTGSHETGLTLSSTSLAQAVEDAAVALRGLYTTGNPFMVCEWNVTGSGISSTGVSSDPAAFTGLIAAAADPIELSQLRTTEGASHVAGGPPPVQGCSITSTGSDTCVFTFETSSLTTDGTPTQTYPSGTVTFTLENQTAGLTLTGTLVFDGTSTAVLNVDTVTGHFDIDMETHGVVHRP